MLPPPKKSRKKAQQQPNQEGIEGAREAAEGRRQGR